VKPYRRALVQAGLAPIDFTPGGPAALDNVDGVLLTGGSDVDPALYGAAKDERTGDVDRERDDYEAALTHEALDREMPLLAICRGMQLLNVVLGGTLIQHLPNTEKHQQRTGGAPVHEVVAQPEFAAIAGSARFPVNSRHHQAIERPGEGLVIAARDPQDRVVEAALVAGKPVVAVQWHPEDMIDNSEPHRRIFEWLAETVRERR